MRINIFQSGIKGKIMSALLSICLIAGSFTFIPLTARAADTVQWQNPFSDVHTGDWFYNDVGYVYTDNLMTGAGTNPMLFSPQTTLTRGMIVTILYREAESPDVSISTNPFSDVPSGQWYTDAVKWAAVNGIVSGYSGGLFGPNDNVTREQLVTILWRYAQWAGIDVSVGEDTNILSYNDVFDISEYAISAFQWACGAQVVQGTQDGNLNPKGNATRAEVAAMITRFLTTGQTTPTPAPTPANDTLPVITLTLNPTARTYGNVTVSVSVQSENGIALIGWRSSSSGASYTDKTDFTNITSSKQFTVSYNGWYAACAIDSAGNYAYQLIHVTNILYNFGGGGSGSYTPPGQTQVAQPALSITGVPTAIAYGDAPFWLSTTGGAGTGAVMWSSSDPSVATADGSGKATVVKVGTTTITATKAADNNYLATTAQTTITVSPATLTVKADNKSMLAGDTVPTLTLSYSGFVNGETAASLTTQPTVSVTGSTTTAGTRAITVSSGVSDNYAFIYVSGTLTVNGSYILTFDANGGTNPPGPYFFADDGMWVANLSTIYRYITPTPMTPPVSGQIFVGWNTKADGSGTFYDPVNYTSTTVPMTSDVTLYAMWSGDGSSAGGPVLVYDYDTLNAVRNGLGLYYKVVADIDAGSAWVPVGSYPHFSGIFDGNGHIITINGFASSTQYIGLFSALDTGGVIQDLRVDGAINYTSSPSLPCNLGAILGDNNGGTIRNCVVVADVTGVSTSTTSGYNIAAGGIVGVNGVGTIQNCYTTGTISASSNSTNIQSLAGGIIGQNFGTVTACYATGSVTASSLSASYAGGIVGANAYGAVMTNCVALNSGVTGIGAPLNIGRVAGYNNPSSSMYTNNYAISISSLPDGTFTDINGVTITTADAITQDAYLYSGANFSFGTGDSGPWVWGAFPGYPLPTLYWQTSAPVSPAQFTP